MKKFIIKSLGCKQNALEGQIIQNKLSDCGFELTDDIKDADIYILNSCTVTSHADSETGYLLERAKRQNNKIKTVLTGCCAQTIKEHKNFNYSDIDLILGNSEKLKIEKYIGNLFCNEKNVFVKNIFNINEFENEFLYSPNSTRVPIKIQDGCNNRCSYCIIPYARGNSRSNSAENIIKQINIAAANGIKEIVLTGVHIGQWGKERGLKFIDILKEIEKTEIPRYRLGSLYINELDDDLICFLKESKKFCEHFHLSLQSLCDKTLKNMNRSYSADEALETIKKLHENFNSAYMGCDIIAGFPYENDEDFNTTYENLKKAKLSSVHCFPYSRRENTPAYFMPQIQDKIKTERCKKILELSKKLHKEFLERNKNTFAEILIEKKSPKTGLYSAVTRNYIKIHFRDENENLRHGLKIVNLNDFELE